MDEIEKIFSNENNHLYGRIDIDYMSVCGCGSQLDDSTLNLRLNLYNFLNKYDIKSVFDSPCGDFWWMKHVDFKDIKYIGGDIITSQIKKMNLLYPNINFIRFDLTVDVLPDVDLLFCRDCLFHFSNDHKKLLFNNFINSNIKYILMSNHPLSCENLNINTGEFSHINWQLSPWNFEQPIDTLYDSNIGYDKKELQLYSKDQIKNFLNL